MTVPTKLSVNKCKYTLSLLINSVEKPNIQFPNTAKLLAMFEVMFFGRPGFVKFRTEWFCTKGVYIAF